MNKQLLSSKLDVYKGMDGQYESFGGFYVGLHGRPGYGCSAPGGNIAPPVYDNYKHNGAEYFVNPELGARNINGNSGGVTGQQYYAASRNQQQQQQQLVAAAAAPPPVRQTNMNDSHYSSRYRHHNEIYHPNNEYNDMDGGVSTFKGFYVDKISPIAGHPENHHMHYDHNHDDQRQRQPAYYGNRQPVGAATAGNRPNQSSYSSSPPQRQRQQSQPQPQQQQERRNDQQQQVGDMHGYPSGQYGGASRGVDNMKPQAQRQPQKQQQEQAHQYNQQQVGDMHSNPSGRYSAGATRGVAGNVNPPPPQRQPQYQPSQQKQQQLRFGDMHGDSLGRLGTSNMNPSQSNFKNSAGSSPPPLQSDFTKNPQPTPSVEGNVNSPPQQRQPQYYQQSQQKQQQQQLPLRFGEMHGGPGSMNRTPQSQRNFQNSAVPPPLQRDFTKNPPPDIRQINQDGRYNEADGAVKTFKGFYSGKVNDPIYSIRGDHHMHYYDVKTGWREDNARRYGSTSNHVLSA